MYRKLDIQYICLSLHNFFSLSKRALLCKDLLSANLVGCTNDQCLAMQRLKNLLYTNLFRCKKTQVTNKTSNI